MLMDSLFLADDVESSNLLQCFFQSFGCTYVCIWSYLPHPSNICLIFKDGLLLEARNNQVQRSLSSESPARRMFNEYKRSTINVDNDVNGFVPGHAFKNNTPFFELKEFDLQGFASLEIQRQFYLEANIKRAIFMGCSRGEIELGFGSATQLNLEMELRKYFPDDFSRRVQHKEIDHHNSTMAHQDPQASSSSSSLRSLSIGSPETSVYYSNAQAFRPTGMLFPSSSRLASTDIPPYQSAMQTFCITPDSHFRSEAENDVMTSAILAILSTSSTTLPRSSMPYLDSLASQEGRSISRRNETSAFQRYMNTNLPSSSTTGQILQNPNRVSAFKRIITYTFNILNLRRLQEMHTQSSGIGKRPTSSQLQHMISERKRRVKMNESFDALRALLPPGTKKHKALVLNGAIDHLTSLQSQVSELSLRNLRLEAQLLPRTETQQDKSSSSAVESGSDNIEVHKVSEWNDGMLVDVRVTVQREVSLLSAVTRVVEFLRRVNGLSIMSMEAETLLATDTSSAPSNQMFFRLRIEASEWDESAFQEALRRVVSDVAPSDQP